ncbi:hypothetical protein JI752_016520 [Lysobacter sp. MMG2]|uniref:hypothetical protein n=1 Tax=Lysobacter sp. MMG2 TaxID=2801338 RepID=UPI001C240AC2|nr:hypothetical protein [Lysobacter sp. MMG2]MBU8977754.1 hypothetical protein [Lysobacter sp. MMG2]
MTDLHPCGAVGDIPPRTCLLLQALLASRDGPLPLAPTLALTIALLDELEGDGVIAVDWRVRPQTREGPWALRWRLSPDVAAIDALPDWLGARLHSAPLMPMLPALCLPLWQALIVAEATAFHARRLRRCGWDPDAAADVADVADRLPTPLAVMQWRRCSRAALMQASAIGPTRWPHEARREVAYQALLRHASVVIVSPPPRRRPAATPPPTTALARLLVALLGLEDRYFRAPPTPEALGPPFHLDRALRRCSTHSRT